MKLNVKLKTRDEMLGRCRILATETFTTERLKLEKESALTRIREQYDPQIAAHSDLADACEADLRDWARRNRKIEFGTKQSIETPYVTLKFYMGKLTLRTIGGAKWPAILAKIKAAGLKQFIRTKETVDKPTLIKWDGKTMKSSSGEFTFDDLQVRTGRTERFTAVVTREPEPIKQS